MSAALVWFRADLRLDDNPAVRSARACARRVDGVFVRDPQLWRPALPRTRLLEDSLHELHAAMGTADDSLSVVDGEHATCVVRAARAVEARVVHACSTGTPLARRQEGLVAAALATDSRQLVVHDDRQLVDPDALSSKAGRPIATFAAFSRAVRSLPWSEPDLRVVPSAALERLAAFRAGGLAEYEQRRDRVDLADATSQLSPALHLGLLSVRRVAAAARAAGAERWLDELLWREWFGYLLHHHPRLAEVPLAGTWERLEWPGDDRAFDLWTRGETGFGLVDAGMRELRETGWMHNRVRMVCASFLVKHLHVDWRRGERWFREHLVDGDLASNAGNWQWVTGLGPDSAPYFRIFNPDRQAARFDPEGRYVARFAADRPAPILDLARERERALARYRRAAAAA